MDLLSIALARFALILCFFGFLRPLGGNQIRNGVRRHLIHHFSLPLADILIISLLPIVLCWLFSIKVLGLNLRNQSRSCFSSGLDYKSLMVFLLVIMGNRLHLTISRNSLSVQLLPHLPHVVRILLHYLFIFLRSFFCLRTISMRIEFSRWTIVSAQLLFIECIWAESWRQQHGSLLWRLPILHYRLSTALSRSLCSFTISL